MKTLKQLGIVLFFSIFLSSCATHVNVAYSDLPENMNTVMIKPSAAMEKTSVVVNGKLLVDQKYVKDVTVSGIPDGKSTFQVASDSWVYKDNLDETFELDLQGGQEKTELITRPAYSNGYWTYQVATYLGSFIIALVII